MAILNGNVAVVTGASQGIGRGIAVQLAIAGADVIVTHLPSSSDHENARIVASEIQALRRQAIIVPMNVTDQPSITSAMKEIFNHISRIDILVNNAGVMQLGAGLHTSSTDFDRCFEVNVKGVWNVIQALLPHFMSQGSGRIINISSGAGRRGLPDLPAYCASKAALLSLTQSLAVALGPSGINVNAICPGLIRTAMCEQFGALVAGQGGVSTQEILNDFQGNTPLRRLQTVGDVGAAVVFLASSHARNITGQALNVDGGYLMN
jgi:NAD(P)-dependent dehydrogenase (short-subunit alcohol dehydrogenase family)